MQVRGERAIEMRDLHNCEISSVNLKVKSLSFSRTDIPSDMIEVTHLSNSMVYGLTAVSFFAVLSFISTLALLVNPSIRFLRWKMSFRSFLQENEVTLLIYNLLLADIQTSVGFSINILLGCSWHDSRPIKHMFCSRPVYFRYRCRK